MTGFKLTLAVSLISSAVIAVPSAAETLEDGFYSRNAEGWFFYNEEKEEDEELPEEETKELTQIPQADLPMPQETPKEKPKSNLKVGSVAWINKNLPLYLNNAIDNPTPENIKAYLLLQKMSTDKANRFSNMYSLVVTGDPLFDNSVDQSGTYAVNRLKEHEAKEGMADALSFLSKSTTLLLVLDDSNYSLFQASVVKRISQKYGFKVVTVMARAVPQTNLSSIMPDIMVRPGFDEELNLPILPATLIATDEKVVPFLLGGAADEEFNTRLIKVAYREKFITDAQFKKTRILDIENKNSFADVDISKAADIKNSMPDFVTGLGENSVNYIDPKIIVDLMEQRK